MKVILDFDGVICDSAFEAFRLSLLVDNKLDSIWDDSYDYLYPKFSILRKCVRPAWNYYFVCQEIFCSERKKWEIGPAALEFEINFFNTRRRLIAEDQPRYCALNLIYDEAKCISRIGPFEILTNKNLETVEMLLRHHGICNYVKITSMSKMVGNEKYDLLNDISEPCIFVDDSYQTIIDADKYSSTRNLLASWGYNDVESGVEKIDSLEEILCML